MGGNVKVSEWPIQCTVASGWTGPRFLVVFIWHTSRGKGGIEKWWGGEAKRQVSRSSAFLVSVNLLLHFDRSVRKRRLLSGGKSIFIVDVRSQTGTPRLQRKTNLSPNSSRFAPVDLLLCSCQITHLLIYLLFLFIIVIRNWKRYTMQGIRKKLEGGISTSIN